MPVLELLSGVVLGEVGKTLVLDSLWTTECWQKHFVCQNLTAAEPVELESAIVVPLDTITNTICRRITNVDYGLFVLAAPAGSGKSTFIKMALPKLRTKFSYIKLLRDSTNLFGKNLQESLCIPKHCALSEYLPSGTLIIIDQIDFKADSLPPDVKAYITGLAADSVNSRKFKLIFCVSQPDTAREILSCNGGEKVQEICCRDSLVCSKDQLEAFIRVKLPQLSSAGQETLKSLAKACGNSPGLIERASALADGKDDISKENWKALERYANARAASWRMFASLCDKDVVADEASSRAMHEDPKIRPRA